MGVQKLMLQANWQFFDHKFMGLPLTRYAWFLAIILGTQLLKKPVAALVTRISSRLAAHFSYVQHRETIRDTLFQPMEQLLQTIFYFFAAEQLSGLLDKISIHLSVGSMNQINLSVGDVVDHIFLFVFILFLTRVLARFVDFFVYLRMTRAQAEKNLARLQLLPLLQEMAKLLLWSLSVFWILGSVFHVNIPALITGLGIGGVAIALAGKETVENFFAAFTILSDKPFQTGDIIKLGDVEGVVERIGFRSTRMRNADGAAFIVPNQNLVSQNLVNLTYRTNRMVKLTLNLKYGISPARLNEAMAEIRTELLKIDPVTEPLLVSLETFDKETFQMVVSYSLPHPLPAGVDLKELKRTINLKVFEIISARAVMGTAPGTS